MPLGAIRRGNGAAYWPASQSNMAAGVSAAQSVMVLEERGRQTKDTCSCRELFDVTLAGEDGREFPPLRFSTSRPTPSDKSQDFPRLSQTSSRGGEWLGAGADCFCFGGSSSSCEIVNWVEPTIISLPTPPTPDAGAQLFADFGAIFNRVQNLGP